MNNLLNIKTVLKYLDPVMFISILVFIILLIVQELNPSKKTTIAFLITLCGLILAAIYNS